MESLKAGLQKEVSRMAEDSRLQEERRTAELAAAIKGLDYEKKDLNKKLQDKDARITGGPQIVLWESEMYLFLGILFHIGQSTKVIFSFIAIWGWVSSVPFNVV